MSQDDIQKNKIKRGVIHHHSSSVINNEYLEDFESFFNYMYELIDDLRTFVAKNDKKNILSFSTKIESYTNINTKKEF